MNYGIYNTTETVSIIELFRKTFSDSEGPAEGQMIGELVNNLISETPDQDISVAVARDGSDIVGCILFTRLAFENESECFLMAPVAVRTDYQGKGVGQGLIQFGLTEMQNQGIKLAFTYGDPNFYSKTGFEPVSEQAFKAPLPLSFPHGWMAQSLGEEKIEALSGSSTCVPAFNQPELW
ncbi:acetyltransferase [Vibrio orientalis CIP 102891 = ATCC 33934]|uniref:Acetyltransferase n=1 Tax=Vibrio orientalis CIP 102891 = ATCC 33934 TaxID=675816 RepID=C9QEJ8_VIBOR|nr:N-acetyltransferase [Vibrio orientalis]EEX94471.1 predicted acetyltransferase [Vibrio orientalis CIP 102891 = ATCC 33934]EGU53978.1 acetyltransferase [Vibrio orientalis CIP 102891 = ATCC 33934]